jgi:hypothetical protein
MGGTHSAIHFAKVNEVVLNLSNLTKTLMKNMEANREMISAARGEANLPWAEYAWELYVDLPIFIEKIVISFESVDQDVSSTGKVVFSSLNQTIVAVGNNKPMAAAGAKGMGIWFPSSYHRVYDLATYADTKFAAQGWLEFLYAYWNDFSKGKLKR